MTPSRASQLADHPGTRARSSARSRHFAKDTFGAFERASSLKIASPTSPFSISPSTASFEVATWCPSVLATWLPTATQPTEQPFDGRRLADPYGSRTREFYDPACPIRTDN